MADKPIETTFAVYRALMGFADQKKPFTASELRKKLGYDENSSEANRMHATVNARKRDGIICVVSEGRKRNQSLQVRLDRKKDLHRLMDKARRRENGSERSNASDATLTTPKRVVYLEDRIEVLERVDPLREQELDQVVTEKLDPIVSELASLNEELASLNEELAALKLEVRHLVELWS